MLWILKVLLLTAGSPTGSLVALSKFFRDRYIHGLLCAVQGLALGKSMLRQ